MKKGIIGLFLASFIVGCSGPSEEEINTASSACEKFIAKEMKGSDWLSPEIDTYVFETWVKNGKIVANIGYRDESSNADSSYIVRLCVYDKEQGTISSPSPLNDSEWRK